VTHVTGSTPSSGGFSVFAAKPIDKSMVRLIISLIRPLPRARLAILHGRRTAW